MRGQKICTKCSGITGPRSHKCPHCNNPFIKAKVEPKKIRIISKNNTSKNNTSKGGSKGRGFKLCEKCNRNVGVRTKTCECGYNFVFTPSFLKPKKGVEVDWKELKEGDEIKVMKGSYWPSDREDIEDVYMGYSGKYKVKEIQSDNILAYPSGKNTESGLCVIYCGEEYECKETSLIKRPHKVRLLKKGNQNETI